ncbi:MAG: mechanosensitive ion channel family protein [Rhodomicrobium sp.]
MDEVLNWLRHSNVNFAAVIATVLILLAAAAVITLFNRYIWKLLERLDRRVSYETSLALTRTASAISWIIAAMFVLSLWGISLSGLWALLVSAAAVIGVAFLAVWAMISNITASFFLTIWRPFRLGQTVELLPENLKGQVIDRNMMFTSMREGGGSTLQVPNNLFFQKIFRVSGDPEQSFSKSLEGDGHAKPAGEAAQS